MRSCAALDLIEHLRTLGEVNAVRERNRILRRDTALTTPAVYESMFGDAEATIPATFQVPLPLFSKAVNEYVSTSLF
ncbi:unnamed protein product [Calypogeia fissa]